MAASTRFITLPKEMLLEVASLLHDDHVNRCAVGTPHPLMAFGL